jgi:hypothetical protein
MGDGVTKDARFGAGYLGAVNQGFNNQANGFGTTVHGGVTEPNYIPQAINLNLPTEGHECHYGDAAGHVGTADAKYFARDYYDYGSPNFGYYMWGDIDMRLQSWNEPNNMIAKYGGPNNGWCHSNVAGWCNVAGCLRYKDLIDGHAYHCGSFTNPGMGNPSKLGPGPEGTNYVYPANGWDQGQNYTGMIPVGSLFYMPWGTTAASAGITSRIGGILFEQALLFGWYCYDSSYNGEGGFKMEANCWNHPDFANFRSSGDLDKIRSRLVRASNNTKYNHDTYHCSGGGKPRTLFAPAFS